MPTPAMPAAAHAAVTQPTPSLIVQAEVLLPVTRQAPVVRNEHSQR